MGPTAWARIRLIGGAAVLGVLVWRLGTGPVLAGLRAVGPWSLVAVASLTALTTVCSAWRWQVVARGLGVDLRLPAAVRACYRSQFLNCAVPGGVVGDVHRGLRSGADTGNIGRGLRAVAWERTAGQVVQLAAAAGVLLTLPSPVRPVVPDVLLGGVVVTGVGALTLAVRSRRRTSRGARAVRVAAADVRSGLLARRAWPAVTLASVVVVAGHTASFLIAARTAGSTASVARLLPLAMLVLLAMAVPVNLGGWGPREGVAAWTFAAAGLSAAQGLAVATAYGVLALVATLPGLGVLVADGLARRPAATTQVMYRAEDRQHPGVLVRTRPEGAAHG